MKTVAFVRTTNIFDDSRATKEISTLLEGGYKVVIIGWDRNGEAEIKTKQIFLEQNVECRFFHCILPTGIGLKNIDKLIRWVYWSKKQLNNIDGLAAVHACNLDGGYGAYQFCKKKNIPLIYDIYDYYVDSHSIPVRAKRFVEEQEIKIINFAKVTIICTEERKTQIDKANPNSLLVIYNSPDVNEFNETECEYDYAYCGSLCDKRLIKEILMKYIDYQDYKFAFAGNDKYKQDIEEFSTRYRNIEFYGTVSYSEVLEIEKKAKVLSAIYEPSIRNHQLCAPNKFYEALALGKPIIVCRGTGIDKVVEDMKIGLVIDYSAEEFYGALKELTGSIDLMREMGHRARSLYENRFRWSLMKKKLLEVYSNL